MHIISLSKQINMQLYIYIHVFVIVYHCIILYLNYIYMWQIRMQYCAVLCSPYARKQSGASSIVSSPSRSYDDFDSKQHLHFYKMRLRKLGLNVTCLSNSKLILNHIDPQHYVSCQVPRRTAHSNHERSLQWQFNPLGAQARSQARHPVPCRSAQSRRSTNWRHPPGNPSEPPEKVTSILVELGIATVTISHILTLECCICFDVQHTTVLHAVQVQLSQISKSWHELPVCNQ